MKFPARKCGACSLAGVVFACAALLSACGSGEASSVSAQQNATLTSLITSVVTPTLALSTPVLSFVSPLESLDLANYTLVAKYPLPVGSGSNLLASEASAITYNPDTDTLFMVSTAERRLPSSAKPAC